MAWLPDIIPSLWNGTSLSLIEVYTTEITYVLDMGVISPLMFICLYLLKLKDGMGDVLLGIILKACSIIGIMVIVQTVVQYLAGIVWPLPVIITKVGIFVVLAGFAAFFDIKLYKNLEV
ncbi:hypothetical protein [Bacillus sp. T3]|uniref:hypothetical protein n=1 Tax=Bacillus sp. T3 TaxID=467262 RepID=UPI002981D9BA|nr:hypothetical protein [Bacillus sp. T3]